MEKIYRVQMNSKGMPNFSTAVEIADRPQGEWITIWDSDDPDTSHEGRCSECGRVSKRPLGDFCKWCGARMVK